MAEKIVEVDGKRYMKVQKGKYFDKKKNRKMRRHHPVRWILISAFCLLVVAPVGFIFGAFYDPTTKNLPDTYDKFTNNIANSIAKGFDELGPDNPKFSMTLDNNFTDSILVAAFKNIAKNPTASKFIKKIYCEMKGENTNFYIDLQASFFKTRVVIQTTLKTETRNNEETYVFKINNFRLGRLPLGNLAKSIIPQFISDDVIQNAIKSIGLNAKFSLANMEITYPRSSLKDDLGPILEGAGVALDNPIGNIILNLFDSLKPVVKYDSGISFELDFTNIGKPKVTARHGIYNNLVKDELTFAQFCEDSLNKKYIVAATDKDKGIYNSVENLYNFLLTGNQTYINDLFKGEDKENFRIDFKTAFNCTYDAYTGQATFIKNKCSDIGTAITKTKTEGEKYYYSQLESLDADKLLTFAKNVSKKEKSINETITLCSIGDDLLSDYIRSTPAAGFTIPIVNQVGDSTYNVSIMCLDDFSINIEENNKLDIVANLSMNGLSVPVTIRNNITTPTQSEPITKANRTIKFEPSEVYLGQIEIGTLKNYMFNFLNNVLKDGEMFKLCSKTEGQVTTYWFEFAFDNIKFGETIHFYAIIKKIIEGTDTIDLHDISETFEEGKYYLNTKNINLKFSETKKDDNVITLDVKFENTNSYIDI